MHRSMILPHLRGKKKNSEEISSFVKEQEKMKDHEICLFSRPIAVTTDYFQMRILGIKPSLDWTLRPAAPMLFEPGVLEGKMLLQTDVCPSAPEQRELLVPFSDSHIYMDNMEKPFSDSDAVPEYLKKYGDEDHIYSAYRLKRYRRGGILTGYDAHHLVTYFKKQGTIWTKSTAKAPVDIHVEGSFDDLIGNKMKSIKVI